MGFSVVETYHTPLSSARSGLSLRTRLRTLIIIHSVSRSLSDFDFEKLIYSRQCEKKKRQKREEENFSIESQQQHKKIISAATAPFH